MDGDVQRLLRHEHRAGGDGVERGDDPATGQDGRVRLAETRREMRDRVGNGLGRPVQRRRDVEACHLIPFRARCPL
jgi:hypothetical protein